MVHQPPGIPKPDTTGQKESQAKRYNQTGKHDPARELDEKV
jgi:hypothetical protein